MVKVTKKGNKSWVTFSILPQTRNSVEICGEWNNWRSEPMKTKKNGEFYITKVLKPDNNYQFGYKINDNEWFCDDGLERVNTEFNSQNSLLKI